jgi:hypothetical protein
MDWSLTFPRDRNFDFSVLLSDQRWQLLYCLDSFDLGNVPYTAIWCATITDNIALHKMHVCHFVKGLH